jgi:tetratricopeptide (TPR) repeat protein
LPVNVIEEEQEKLKEIITKGMESFQNGNADEALAIAEHAIMTNPSYAEAYALKGLAHERKGAYAEALDAYETVVALNPDSTIDKIKLNQLRNAFAQRQAGDPKPDRKTAGIMAMAATLLFASVGAVIYGIGQSQNTATKTGGIPQVSQGNTLASNQGTAQTPVPQGTQDTNQPAVNTQTAPGDVKALNEANQQGTTDRTFSPGGGTGRRSSGNSRPNGFAGMVPPIEVVGPDGQMIGQLPDVNGTKPVAPLKGPDVEDPKPPPVNESSAVRPKEDVDAESPGVYEIKESTKSRNGTAPTQPTNSSSGKSAQREGQNHMRNGKSAEAKASFNRAKEAYEKDLASGKGDKEATQAALNSVNQALKNIKD